MASVSSEELQEAWERVKKMGKLPEAPSPKVPTFTARMPIKTRLLAIQHYLNALEYNYTGTLYFDVNKNRSFKSIVNTAKEITNDMLPIQCLEAVFVAAYLTANQPDLERFPISFKSECGTTVHRHIVLAVRHQHSKWGALGLSRSEKLMFKELRFNSLSELIEEYRHGFHSVCHSVTKIYIGFPFPHDIHSSEKVEWRVLNVPVDDSTWSDVSTHVDTFAKEALDVLAFKRAKGVLPDQFQTKYPLHTPEKEPGKKSPDKRSLLNGAAFEFPATPTEEENTSPPPAVANASPEKPPTPILVAPDALVFKRAMANQAQVMPSNIFLQNTTTSPFDVEIHDPTGHLEIVTKSTMTLVNPADQPAEKPGSRSCFRVSARGMIVIALKCKHPTEAAAAAAAAAQLPPPSAPTSTAGAAATSASRKPNGELKKQRTPRGTVTSPQKVIVPVAVAPEPPRNVVYFRCTRIGHATEDQTNEQDGTETYCTELPFSITS